MAPEVIKGTGYGLSADIWSIGIILYEFVCGSLPFGEEEDDPFKVYNKVLDHVLKYPSYISSNKAKAVIEKCLIPILHEGVCKDMEGPCLVCWT